MPLKETEKALGAKLKAAAKGANGDGDIAWERVAEAITEHITANALVTGTAPSGGGPITLGKVE